MMKKMKRLVAVLLAGVMALTMLTACGSKIIPIERNDAVEKTVSAIAEKYEIGAMTDAETVEKLDKLANDLLDELVNSEYTSLLTADINAVAEKWEESVTAIDSYSEAIAEPMLGLSEYQASFYYETYLDRLLSSVAGRLPEGCEYFAQVYHITNPTNAEDSIWIMFAVLVAPQT